MQTHWSTQCASYLDWRVGAVGCGQGGHALRVAGAETDVRAELMKYLQMGVRSACRDKPDVVYIPRKQVLLFSYCPRAFA